MKIILPPHYKKQLESASRKELKSRVAFLEDKIAEPCMACSKKSIYLTKDNYCDDRCKEIYELKDRANKLFVDLNEAHSKLYVARLRFDDIRCELRRFNIYYCECLSSPFFCKNCLDQLEKSMKDLSEFTKIKKTFNHDNCAPKGTAIYIILVGMVLGMFVALPLLKLIK